jgi:hypothetical protein
MSPLNHHHGNLGSSSISFGQHLPIQSSVGGGNGVSPQLNHNQSD